MILPGAQSNYASSTREDQDASNHLNQDTLRPISVARLRQQQSEIEGFSNKFDTYLHSQEVLRHQAIDFIKNYQEKDQSYQNLTQELKQLETDIISQREAYDSQEQLMNEFSNTIQTLRHQAERQLETIMPRLQLSFQQAEQIRMQDMYEVMSLCSPPQLMVEVLTPLLKLLYGNFNGPFRQYLNIRCRSLVVDMRNINIEQLSDQVVQQARSSIANIPPDRVACVSWFCHCCFIYMEGVLSAHQVYRQIAPIRQQIHELETRTYVESEKRRQIQSLLEEYSCKKQALEQQIILGQQFLDQNKDDYTKFIEVYDGLCNVQDYLRDLIKKSEKIQIRLDSADLLSYIEYQEASKRGVPLYLLLQDIQQSRNYETHSVTIDCAKKILNRRLKFLRQQIKQTLEIYDPILITDGLIQVDFLTHKNFQIKDQTPEKSEQNPRDEQENFINLDLDLELLMVLVDNLEFLYDFKSQKTRKHTNQQQLQQILQLICTDPPDFKKLAKLNFIFDKRQHVKLNRKCIEIVATIIQFCARHKLVGATHLLLTRVYKWKQEKSQFDWELLKDLNDIVVSFIEVKSDYQSNLFEFFFSAKVLSKETSIIENFIETFMSEKKVQINEFHIALVSQCFQFLLQQRNYPVSQFFQAIDSARNNLENLQKCLQKSSSDYDEMAEIYQDAFKLKDVELIKLNGIIQEGEKELAQIQAWMQQATEFLNQLMLGLSNLQTKLSETKLLESENIKIHSFQDQFKFIKRLNFQLEFQNDLLYLSYWGVIMLILNQPRTLASIKMYSQLYKLKLILSHSVSEIGPEFLKEAQALLEKNDPESEHQHIKPLKSYLKMKCQQIISFQKIQECKKNIQELEQQITSQYEKINDQKYAIKSMQENENTVKNKILQLTEQTSLLSRQILLITDDLKVYEHFEESKTWFTIATAQFTPNFILELSIKLAICQSSSNEESAGEFLKYVYQNQELVDQLRKFHSIDFFQDTQTARDCFNQIIKAIFLVNSTRLSAEQPFTNNQALKHLDKFASFPNLFKSVYIPYYSKEFEHRYVYNPFFVFVYKFIVRIAFIKAGNIDGIFHFAIKLVSDVLKERDSQDQDLSNFSKPILQFREFFQRDSKLSNEKLDELLAIELQEAFPETKFNKPTEKQLTIQDYLLSLASK